MLESMPLYHQLADQIHLGVARREHRRRMPGEVQPRQLHAVFEYETPLVRQRCVGHLHARHVRIIAAQRLERVALLFDLGLRADPQPPELFGMGIHELRVNGRHRLLDLSRWPSGGELEEGARGGGDGETVEGGPLVVGQGGGAPQPDPGAQPGVTAAGKQDLDGAAKSWQQVVDIAPDSPEGLEG